MINQLITFSVKNRFFIFLLTLLIVLWGIKSFEELPIDAVPDITNTQVQINTSTSGLIPEEVERMVTYPIESSMNGIPGVESVRSISRYGISQVTVIFNEGTDIYRARQLTGERLQDLDLPEGMKPEMGPISTGLGEVFHYQIEAKEIAENERERLLQLMELRALQEWFIKPRLLSLKGVTEVNTIGGHLKQFFIQPSITKMAAYGIHFDDIESAISSTNKNVGGGYVEQTGEQLLVRGSGLLKTLTDLENVVVKRLTTLEVIRIKDIAEVKLDQEMRTGAGTVDGEEAVLGTVFMLLGENSRSVSETIGDEISRIKADLPAWARIRVLYDRSDMVNATLGTVEHNLLMGAGLVIVFLLLLVGNYRAAFITALTIPISLLMTFMLMKWRGVSGNLMSLGALDFGIIVDGTVIVVENCVHRLEMKGRELGRALTRQELSDLVIDSAIEIRKAAGFGELIVIVVFIPLFALTGVEGKMFTPMATTFVMALASALLLSFTLVPALAATILSGQTKDERPWPMRVSEKLFAPVLDFALKIKKVVFGFGVTAIVMGLLLFSRMGSEFIPQLDEGDFALQFIRPPNISLSTSIELQKASEKVVKSFPQVKAVFARTGAAEVATDPMGVNISDSYVMLYPRDDWPSDGAQTKKELMQEIRQRVEALVPAQVLMISQPVELRFNELLEGTRSKVSAKIFGPDLEVLTEKASELASIISTIPNAGEVESELKGKSPVLEYTPRIDVLASLGVNTLPVLEAIETAFAGKKVGVIFDNVRQYPIITKLANQDRENLDVMKSLPVGIDENYTLPISKLATLDYLETYTAISRENTNRRVAVLINPATRDVESFVLKAQEEVSKKLELPEGYYLEWGGTFKNLQSAKARLSVLVPLAILVILAMLYGAFKNFAQVALIFLCAPMAIIGGVVALNLLGMPFSISAGVGFIALIGISILNGVVLVTYFNKLSLEGVDPDEVVRRGALSRLRPVLMTALTDIFGFLPMMYSSGLGAEVQRPLATVVVGGIISATLLTLIVLPTLYRLFYTRVKPSLE